MDSSGNVKNGIVLNKKNSRETADAKPVSKQSCFTNRGVSKHPTQSKRYSGSQANHLNKAKKNKASRKVDKFIYPKLDSTVKVRNFVNNLISGSDVILKNISSDFDKAKRQISQLKDEVEYLSKEITIANSNEILRELDIDFTLLEELQDSSVDVKSITENHIKQVQISLKELYKEIRSTKYIKYNKPKIILIVRYILECIRSLSNYIFKKEYAKIQDQDKFVSNQQKIVTVDKNQQSSETTLDIAQDDKQNYTDFDSASNQAKNSDSNPTAIDKDVLEEDGVYFDSRETIADDDIENLQDSNKKLIQTVNISNSTLKNYGNTCWLNSSIKLLYVLYGDRIKTKAKSQLENSQINLEEKNIYASILALFNKLDTQEDASQEISKFLANMFIYGRYVVSHNKDIPTIAHIYFLIKDIIFTTKTDPDDEKQDIISLDLTSIKQCSADEFIGNFIGFMDLNDDSNSIGEINLVERYLNANLLNQMGFSNTDKPKAIKRYKIPEYRSSLIAINTENLQESDTNKDDLVRMLYDDSNTSDFSNEEKYKITNFLSANNIDSTQGLVEVAYTREFTANIEQLKTVTVNLQAANQNSLQKNRERLNQLFDENYPYIVFNILNRNDNKRYKVTAKAISCVAHKGSLMTEGHYIACSIDENNKVMIHNDISNYKLPETENLQSFVKKDDFTPVVIGYAVTDKQLIGDDSS